MLDRQPVLAGEQVFARPLLGEDWQALFAVAADPALWALHPMHDRWRKEVFRKFFDEAIADGGALAVLDPASGAMIGSSRFHAYDRADGGSVEIGWTFLARSHWGTGANRELKRLMVGHALASVARVYFRVGETNLRSRRALEKIGARLLQDGVEQMDVPGIGPIVHLCYEMCQADFARVLGAD